MYRYSMWSFYIIFYFIWSTELKRLKSKLYGTSSFCQTKQSIQIIYSKLFSMLGKNSNYCFLQFSYSTYWKRNKKNKEIHFLIQRFRICQFVTLTTFIDCFKTRRVKLTRWKSCQQVCKFPLLQSHLHRFINFVSRRHWMNGSLSSA